MRNMSFALTAMQMLEGTKTVTRRLGWLHLKVDDQLCPVRKCMGLRPGEKVEVLRDPIRVLAVRREPLRAMLDDLQYGRLECEREGFGSLTPAAFVAMFRTTHGCELDSMVTRIKFTYVVPPITAACLGSQFGVTS